MSDHWQITMPILGWSGSGPAKAIVVGNEARECKGREIGVYSPIDGEPIALVKMAKPKDVTAVVTAASKAFVKWRTIPAPERGRLVAKIGDLVRRHKVHLAQFITVEAGKTHQEALGEVQEWIDICDYAVGLSRQLFGLTIASERKDHRMMEQWLPLGNVAVITAFNFPMAVWAWNTMLAFVCGNSVIWKPSEKTPLCALACQTIVSRALQEFPEWEDFSVGLSSIVIGDGEVGQVLAENSDIPLVSATGSVPMGKKVAATVGARLGRSLLELGGNNALILTPSADLDLAIRAIVFAAVGTSGQRCTTLRRLIVHSSIAEQVTAAVKKAFAQVTIGDPQKEENLLGPLIDEAAFQAMQDALKKAQAEGGTLIYGGNRVTENIPGSGVYVEPALVAMPQQSDVVCDETFAPILYLLTYENLEDAIALQNNVPQGLSSAIFTNQMREAELFLSPAGSDCGIANVNIGTSGAEIGGAFGGEKETGGGRESGSDSWKNYMRRATNTINYGTDLPLAQGIKFDL